MWQAGAGRKAGLSPQHWTAPCSHLHFFPGSSVSGCPVPAGREYPLSPGLPQRIPVCQAVEKSPATEKGQPVTPGRTDELQCLQALGSYGTCLWYPKRLPGSQDKRGLPEPQARHPAFPALWRLASELEKARGDSASLCFDEPTIFSSFGLSGTMLRRCSRLLDKELQSCVIERRQT